MRIALAGLGNVGSSVLRLLRGNAELIAKRAGQAITIVAVSARSKSKTRDCDLAGIDWVEAPLALGERSDIDTVVEVIGGAEGIAFDLAKTVLAKGKHFATANKAMIAAHGVELASLAEKNKVQLAFEASVCGGLPVLNLLREGLAANEISSVRGILNGTCNYILTRMADKGLSFDDALAEAQRHGYAEAEPSADIDGYDTANKLAILTALAFGTAPDLPAVFVEGIRAITSADLSVAASRGGCIKLLGIAEKTASGIVQRVQPVFVPLNEALARVGGAENAVEISCDFAGPIFMQGAGAGGNATASAVIADLIDIARGHRGAAFGIAAASSF